MGRDHREDAELPVEAASGSFAGTRRVVLIAAGRLWSSAACVRYRTCVANAPASPRDLWRTAPPGLLCRHPHGGPRDLRATRKRECAERRLPVRGVITSRLTWFRRLACAR